MIRPLARGDSRLHGLFQLELGDLAGGGAVQGVHDAAFARDLVVGELLETEPQDLVRFKARVTERADSSHSQAHGKRVLPGRVPAGFRSR